MTIRRWTPSTWVLASLGCVILLVGADQIQRAIHPPKPPTPAKRTPPKNGFQPRPGVQAVNFQLPDAQKKVHRLSDFKGQQLVLTFFCGCAACRDMAKQMGTAYKASHKTPTTLAVFTSHMQPEGIPNFVRTTGTESVTYVEDPDDRIVKEYIGTPCPTVLVLNKDQKIIYRSKKYRPPTNVPTMKDLAHVLDLDYTPPKDAPQHPMLSPEEPFARDATEPTALPLINAPGHLKAKSPPGGLKG